jgi:hypothetical protein
MQTSDKLRRAGFFLFVLLSLFGTLFVSSNQASNSSDKEQNCRFVRVELCPSLPVNNLARVESIRASQGYLSQGLPHPRYHVEGRAVERIDAQNFIAEFPATFEEALGWKSAFLEAGSEIFTGRLKTVDSLLAKMHGRFSNVFTLDNVHDIVGVRAVISSIEAQNRLVKWMYRQFEIVVHMNYVTRDLKPDGFRAHNLTVRANSQRLVEVQVMTFNQLAFANFTHDQIYKSRDESLKSDLAVKAYLKALGDTLYRKDLNPRSEMNLPVPPQSLVKRGLLFKL